MRPWMSRAEVNRQKQSKSGLAAGMVGGTVGRLVRAGPGLPAYIAI